MGLKRERFFLGNFLSSKDELVITNYKEFRLFQLLHQKSLKLLYPKSRW